MGVAAGHWYESPITGLVLTILLAMGTSVIGWWSIRPKRLILLDMPQAGILPFDKEESHSWPDSGADQPGSASGSLHIIKVDLRTKGRWDVASTAFDSDLPLILDVGVPILSMKTVQPTGIPQLKAEIAGTELRIGPGLARRRRMWTFTLLTAGIATRFTYVNPLIDVDIRTPAEQRRRKRTYWAIAVPMYLFTVWAMYRLGVLAKIADSLATFVNSL